MLAQETSVPVQEVVNVAPIILSRTSQVSEQTNSSLKAAAKIRHDGHYEKEGKRWVRRRDNSRFAGNGHIVKPSSKDFSLSLSLPRATFPKPLPPFIPRHLSAPSAAAPHRDPISANAGRYSLSLKGVRKELRRSGPRTEQIVLDIEQELTEWLQMGGVLLSPEAQHTLSPSGMPGTPIGSSRSIHEVRRTPMELIWRIEEDFPRFLLHCVARFHGVVSFSKSASGGERDIRLTHLLRPNVTRPDFAAPGALYTPPASDIDALSAIVDTEDSDVASELALGSEEGDLASSPLALSGFLPEEGHGPPIRSLSRHYHASLDDTESSVGEERDDDALSLSVDSLTLGADARDWEQTPRRRLGGARAVSSPSRSPSRPVRRTPRRVPPAQVLADNRLGFWHWVFA